MQEVKKNKPKPLLSSSSSKRAKELLEKVNLPKIICIHLIGENHSMHHRMGAGVIIMTIGVMISKTASGISFYLVSFLGDMIGYLIHGIGTLPFAEALSTHINSAKSSVERVEEGKEGDGDGLS